MTRLLALAAITFTMAGLSAQLRSPEMGDLGQQFGGDAVRDQRAAKAV
jgi:hypothetical protein